MESPFAYTKPVAQGIGNELPDPVRVIRLVTPIREQKVPWVYSRIIEMFTTAATSSQPQGLTASSAVFDETVRISWLTMLRSAIASRVPLSKCSAGHLEQLRRHGSQPWKLLANDPPNRTRAFPLHLSVQERCDWSPAYLNSDGNAPGAPHQETRSGLCFGWSSSLMRTLTVPDRCLGLPRHLICHESCDLQFPCITHRNTIDSRVLAIWLLL